MRATAPVFGPWRLRMRSSHQGNSLAERQPDPDWASWYAHYLFDEQTGHLAQAMQEEQAVRLDRAQQAGSA